MSDKIFVKGLYAKDLENAPDFIKARFSVNCKDFCEFMKANEKKGWLNIDIKESKEGRLYAELDTWEPNQQSSPEDTGCPF
jgi:hypothetical protein